MTLNISEQIKQNEDILDAYEVSLGIPKIEEPGLDTELQEYLSMNRDVIEALQPQAIWSISVRLSQFSFFINRSVNRRKSLVTFLNHEINKIVAGEINQYDKYSKHEVKVYQICRSNPAAVELLRAKSYAEQIVERLEDLSSGVKNLSYVLSMAYKNKIGERE